MINLSKETVKSLVVLFFTSLFFFYGFGLNNMFNALGGQLMETYQLSPEGLGWISSLYFWANVISLIPMGILCDRTSPRVVILCALVLSVMTVVAIAVSSELWVLIVARLFMGMAGGCIFVGCIRIAVNWFSLSHMARVVGFIVTMGMLGGFMVQSPFIALINLLDWREALLIVALVGVVIAILIAAFVRDVPQKIKPSFDPFNHEEHEHSGNLDSRTQKKLVEKKIVKKESEEIKKSLCGNLKIAFKNPQNWLAGLAGSLNNLPIFLLGALWGVPYLMSVERLSNTEAGLVSGMLYFGTMVGSPLMGMISDGLKRRKLPMLAGILLSIVIIEICLNLQHVSLLVWCLVFFLLGMTASAQVLAYPIVAESNPHPVISTATSIISIQMLLGGAISEPLFGYILDKMGGGNSPMAYEAAIKILPIAFVLAFIVALFIRETRAQR